VSPAKLKKQIDKAKSKLEAQEANAAEQA